LNPTPCNFWSPKCPLHGQLPSFFKIVSFIFNGFVTLLDAALHGLSHASIGFLVSLVLIHRHSLYSHSELNNSKSVGPSWEIPHVFDFLFVWLHDGVLSFCKFPFDSAPPEKVTL
jgi:hypothetical protein